MRASGRAAQGDSSARQTLRCAEHIKECGAKLYLAACKAESRIAIALQAGSADATNTCTPLHAPTVCQRSL
jgi:hypothetical protein